MDRVNGMTEPLLALWAGRVLHIVIPTLAAAQSLGEGLIFLIR